MEKIKQALKIIMSGTEKELNTFIQEFRKGFINMPIEDIAYPRSCNGLQKFRGTDRLFLKGTPNHTKGGILHNYLIQKNKLENKYPLINEGEKIRFVHLKEPNIYQASAFSFITKFPNELDIVDKIDYDTQFTKSFVEPLRFISEKIGWLIDDSYGTQGSLEDFFG